MPYESSLFNAVRLECRMVRDGSANRLLATADEDVFTPEMEGREFLRVTRKYGEAVVEGTQMPFYHLTTLDRDLYKGETFSMDREDGWRQAYTCIRDFSRKNDYQPGVNRPERYYRLFEKFRCQRPRPCQRRVDAGNDGHLGCGVGNLPGVSGRLQLPSQPAGAGVAFREELPAAGRVPEQLYPERQ